MNERGGNRHLNTEEPDKVTAIRKKSVNSVEYEKSKSAFEGKRDELFDRFRVDIANDNDESRGKAIEALVLEFRRLQLGAGNAKYDATIGVDGETKRLAAELDDMDPVSAHAEKMIKLALTGKYAEAGEYASRLGTLREKEVKEAIQNMAASGGNKKHEASNAVIANALAYYDKHKSEYGSKKKAARDLESRFPPVAHGTYYSHIKGR